MTSITGDALESASNVSRRVSILPAVAGALAVLVLLTGAILSGLTTNVNADSAFHTTSTDASSAEIIVWVAAGLVAGAMVTGFVVAHYLGLMLTVVAALLIDDPSLTQTAGVVATLSVCHEIGRFSLDARRPTRFAPGYLRHFALRTTMLTGGALAVVWASDLMTTIDPGKAAAPGALALVAMPLFVRRMMLAAPAALRSFLLLRFATGLLVAAVAMGAAILGANALAGLESEPFPSDAPTPVIEEVEGLDVIPLNEPDEATGAGRNQLWTIAVIVLVLLVMALILVALRRPEVDFELDDVHLDLENRSLGLTNPGEADLDDTTAAIDEQEYLRLLDGLLLDISNEPDPARAIRFGYVTVENRLSDLGVVRQSSETEQELLKRALPVLPGDRSSFVVLTSLFEAARFGVDPVTEDMRSRAVSAVQTLRKTMHSPAVEHDPGAAS